MNAGAPTSGPTLALRELAAKARFARERYQLYNARSYSSRLTSPARLRELEHTSKLAQRRLDRAKAAAAHEAAKGEA